MTSNPSFKRGDWAAQNDVRTPAFGRVVDVFNIDDEWCLNIVLYDLKGNRVGRRSPAMGGPTTFEPACPATNYRKIKRPNFPIEHVGLYGNYDHLLENA